MTKASNQLQVQLQAYNNRLVDEKVKKYKQSNLDDYKIFTESAIYDSVFKLNNPKTVRDFKKLINSPYTSNESLYKKLVRTNADNVTKVISERETTRILTNLKYVEKTLEEATIDFKQYDKLIKNYQAQLTVKDY